MTRDSRVDDYIAKAQPFARPILSHIRELVHRALPDAVEAIKWGVPHFVVNGKNAVGMASFKNHASLMVCSDETAGSGMGNFGKITGLDMLPSDDVLIARFKDGAENAQGRTANQPKPKPAIPMPDDFATALANTAGAEEVWTGFTDAQRRDYLDWVTSAKREATRVKRIATAAEWIGEGKRRNWKYEKC
ncbi:MAG: YdeI/OmpD-associated family protein [Erythrobacter sp.]